MKENKEVFSFVVNEFETNCYIYKDPYSENCVIIDPGGESQKIANFIKDNKLKVQSIILTHGHYDHIKDLEKILTFFPVEVIIHKEEQSLVLDDSQNLSIFLGQKFIFASKNINWKKVEDKETIFCGNQKIKIIHTPGHTIGSICLYIENKYLFSGDTLFCGSVGRTDFPTGDIEMLENSIKRIFSLPKDVKFFPGHGNSCSLSKEKQHNMFLTGVV